MWSPLSCRRRAWLGTAAAVLALGSLPAAAVPPGLESLAEPDLADVALGRALFNGHRPLLGRIAGHDATLPAAVSACTGCHRPRTGLGTQLGAAAAASFGPELSRAFLLQALPRRNGPPSAYTTASLCEALRTGVDPAFVTLLPSMPRYQMSDAECRALWSYLTAAPASRAGVPEEAGDEN
ncbi:hypothetical protein OOT46_14800 [Aquabacterium sp. A7-Y]|uniref:hypothetical protein n=1 Tax=Aquabacterium sp. A7-Y TaxID=1349605 RepID=UPI00223CB268|nr:hypothetical protein [Aquabacterium sp. A7-Y]MCW7539110.1 hypothetical protein [Aquabacterium sp. A7-Y]